jgi:hypothetical protein
VPSGTINTKYEVRYLEQNEYQKWDRFVDNSPQGTLFHKTFWLEASNSPFKLLGCFDKNGELIGGVPLPYKKIWGLTAIIRPPLTPYLGVLIKAGNDQKYVSKISSEKKVIQSLAAGIVRSAHFAYINFHPTFLDLQPFLWNGFSSNVRYTYIADISDISRAWERMDATRRNDIRKGMESGFTCDTKGTLDTFIGLRKQNLVRRSLSSPVPVRQIERYHKTMVEKGQTKMFFVRNAQGEVLASLYMVWDKRRAYYLMGEMNPIAETRSASALAIWEAMQFASRELGLKEFDFEGSNIPQIERFFRKFGGVLTPCYYAIWSKLYLKPLWFGYNNVRYWIRGIKHKLSAGIWKKAQVDEK